jgi:AraC-like DNA-binding protein
MRKYTRDTVWEETGLSSEPFFRIDGPLVIPPPYGAIRAEHFLRGFKPLVGNFGGDWRKILERNNLDPAAADDPDYPLPCMTAASILDDCTRRFDDNLFGLRLAERQDADVFGWVSTYARTAQNMREAIESMVEYLPVLHSPGADVEFVSTNQTAEFRWHPFGDIGIDEQSTEHGLLLFMKLLEALGGKDFQPTYVNAVANIPLRDVAFMEERFRCKVHANAPATAIGLDVAFLDRPLRTSNRILRGLLKSYFLQVKNATRQTLIDQVEAYVRLELASRGCSLDRCAAKLDTTVRTLHRHLTQHGLSFSDIVEQQRCRIARHTLLETGYTLDEIAAMLGYSEQSSFGRAFKRWTGLTPLAYRERLA